MMDEMLGEGNPGVCTVSRLPLEIVVNSPVLLEGLAEAAATWNNSVNVRPHMMLIDIIFQIILKILAEISRQ